MSVVLRIGVDPAQLKTAIAFEYIKADGLTSSRKFVTVGDITEADKVRAAFELVKADAVYDEVLVTVEYIEGKIGASSVVRAAANAYVRILREAFPKCKLAKVQPRSWQAKIFGSARHSDTKTMSLSIAGAAYGWKVDGDHDKADAALILEYGRSFPEIFTCKAKRKKDNQWTKPK